jgi:hypothetical protein
MSKRHKQTKPPKPLHYWKGHDTLEADLAKSRELLDLSREGKYRDGWWRFYAINKIEGPLERVLLTRERGEHYPFKTRWPHATPAAIGYARPASSCPPATSPRNSKKQAHRPSCFQQVGRTIPLNEPRSRPRSSAGHQIINAAGLQSSGHIG